MERLDRRELLRRGVAFVLALGVAPAAARAASAATLPDRRLRELARSLDGSLVTRASPGYPKAKRLYDTRFDAIRPLAIAYCESAADVQACVRWAHRHHVRPAARSGGHSYGGYSTAGGGLIVDVSRLDHVRVSAGRARIGAGAALGDVYERLATKGVTVPGGSCATVGIAGLALGGGAGFSGRKLGLTCDALEELTLVTANGHLRTCSHHRNRDLFWACRGGGGGNFGVVTALAFRTFPVSTVTTFNLAWPWARAAAVVDAWQRWAPAARDELFSVCHLQTAQGGPSVAVSGQLFGSPAELQALLGPLLAAGEPTRRSIVERSFIGAVHYFEGSSGRATFAAKSDYVRRPLPAAGIAKLASAVAARQAAGAAGAILLDAYGGAINRVAPGATAFVHRRERFSIQYEASWAASGAGSAASLAWLRAVHRSMRPYVSGFAYQNYIDPELTTWKHAYYGANLRRLVHVKRQVDPGNLFRFRQSIPTHL